MAVFMPVVAHGVGENHVPLIYWHTALEDCCVQCTILSRYILREPRSESMC